MADHEPCDRCCRHARARDLLALVEARLARGKAGAAV